MKVYDGEKVKTESKKKKKKNEKRRFFSHAFVFSSPSVLFLFFVPIPYLPSSNPRKGIRKINSRII